MKSNFYLQLLLPAFAIVASALATDAQEVRQPSAPIRPFVVKTKQSLADLEKNLGNENKVEDLIGGSGMQLRVAVQHDEKRETAEAEVHDASDDVFYVLKGAAQLILGGRLENPREASRGEWKSLKIIDGQTFTLKKGDLIVVPRGTPHQRINAPSKEFSLILIKIFAEPISSNSKK